MKIFCIGRNYVAHAKELGNEVPESPVVFLKPPTALLKNNQDFYYPPFSKDIQYECEVVLKICKNGKHISEKFASNYFNEISLGIDFTARDLQQNLKEKGLPWEISKGFDGAAVIGHFIPYTKKKNILFSLEKNNNVVQQGDTSLMLFPFEKIISYISEFYTLQTGDLIYTGTPAGVGKVEIGDVLTGKIENDVLFSMEIK